MSEFRGYISRQYTVWCGVCSQWEQVSEHRKHEAEQRFRRMGWKNTRSDGWKCPRCFAAKMKWKPNEQS